MVKEPILYLFVSGLKVVPLIIKPLKSGPKVNSFTI